MILKQLKELFQIEIAQSRLKAEIKQRTKDVPNQLSFTKQDVYDWLEAENITFGIKKEAIRRFYKKQGKLKKPLTIAQGLPPKDGKDGSIAFLFSDTKETSGIRHFSDVMKIPTVKSGQKLAEITLPTKGKDGKDIFGNVLRARRGRPIYMRAGQNVTFDEEEQTFYATTDGQISVTDKNISVYPVYEVDGDLSMKTGHLDFIGTIIIHGDVPSGYTVNAQGDVRIHGIVEAATIKAKGSVFVEEGLAGLQTGTIQAGENVHIGYVNQGIIQAGASVYVKQSIIHSEIKAGKCIYCQHGNIIGGEIEAGEAIEAYQIGNRLQTETSISVGIDLSLQKEKSNLMEQKKDLQNTLEKLELIGRKLKRQPPSLKIEETLRRQRQSITKTRDEIRIVQGKLAEIEEYLSKKKTPKIIIKDKIYPNVNLIFDRYQYKIKTVYESIKITHQQNEMIREPLRDG